MLAAFKRQPHDHVPISPYIWQGVFGREPFSWPDQIKRTEKMLEMGLDPCFDIWFPDPQPHKDVTIKTWRDTSGPEPLITKEYHTPAGVLRQTVRETPDWCGFRHGPWQPTTFGAEKRDHFGMDLFDDYNVSRRTEPWVKGPEDLAKLRYIIRLPEGHVLDEWLMDSQRALEIAKKYGVLSIARRTIVGDAFQWFCDIPDFLCWMVESPEFVTEFLGIFQQWALGLTRLALEAGVDVVQRRGWYEVPTYWGKKFWQKYIVPGVEEETKLVHQAGKIHSFLLPQGQGAYAEILNGMTVEVLQGVDPRYLYEGDLKTLYQKTGGRKSFWGGVNAEVTLASEDETGIESAVKEAIDILNANNGLVLSAFIFQETPHQGIVRFVDAWRKYA